MQKSKYTLGGNLNMKFPLLFAGFRLDEFGIREYQNRQFRPKLGKNCFFHRYLHPCFLSGTPIIKTANSKTTRAACVWPHNPKFSFICIALKERKGIKSTSGLKWEIAWPIITKMFQFHGSSMTTSSSSTEHSGAVVHNRGSAAH